MNQREELIQIFLNHNTNLDLVVKVTPELIDSIMSLFAPNPIDDGVPYYVVVVTCKHTNKDLHISFRGWKAVEEYLPNLKLSQFVLKNIYACSELIY